MREADRLETRFVVYMTAPSSRVALALDLDAPRSLLVRFCAFSKRFATDE